MDPDHRNHCSAFHLYESAGCRRLSAGCNPPRIVVRWGRKRVLVEEEALFFSIVSSILPRIPLELCAHEPLDVVSGPRGEFNPDYPEVPQAQIVEEI